MLAPIRHPWHAYPGRLTGAIVLRALPGSPVSRGRRISGYAVNVCRAVAVARQVQGHAWLFVAG